LPLLNPKPVSTVKALSPEDRQRLEDLVHPIADAHGAELVDVELTSDRSGVVLRVALEKKGATEGKWSTEAAAVDLEACANVSRDLSPALDVNDLFPFRYHLEVGSPGVERALKRLVDYDRFAGQEAKVKLHKALAGQKVVVAKLLGVTADRVRLEEGGRTHELPLSEIESARLVFSFGPAPKPGKAANPKKQQKKS
jgi:ribosome maturation factor RimP